eukprot:10540238-Alexandrium_andersonii.AAC.1
MYSAGAAPDDGPVDLPTDRVAMSDGGDSDRVDARDPFAFDGEMHYAVAERAAHDAGHGSDWSVPSPDGDFLADHELKFAHRVKEGLG